MRIYFLAAVSAKDECGDLYTSIVLELQSQGHSVVADHILTDPHRTEKLSIEKRRAYFDQMRKRISSCDVMVVEISVTTPDIAYEISFALEKEKPVLALYLESSSHEIPTLLEGNTYDKFLLLEYSKSRMAQDITEGLKEVSTLVDVRFNFLISPDQMDFLSKMSKEHKVARAVYLRGLITEHMVGDNDYVQFESIRDKDLDIQEIIK